MSKLNIAYFAFSEEYGGEHAGFTHSYNIVKALADLGVNVKTFFNSRFKLFGGTNLELTGVCFPSLKNILNINPFFYFISYFKVKKLIEDVDLIHERFHVNPIDLIFLKNKHYVLEVNDPVMVLHSSYFYKKLISLKFRKSRCIITQTETLKNILGKYTNKQIYVVANGVDVLQFRPEIKTNIRDVYKIKDKEILVVFVGAFMEWHGVSDIVEMAKMFPRVKFLLIGEGPEFAKVKMLSNGLANFILAGSKKQIDIPKYLAAADILIAPFNTKKFSELDEYGFWWCPVKLFEYMAMGKPVLSYGYYEVRNIVKDGGLLARPGDFNDLIHKSKELINDPKLRKRLGNNARAVALKYDWKYRAKDIKNIYEVVLKNES